MMKEDILLKGKLSSEQLANNMDTLRADGSVAETDIKDNQLVLSSLRDFPKIRLLNKDDIENEYSVRLVDQFSFSIIPKFELEGIMINNKNDMYSRAYKCNIHKDKVILDLYSLKTSLTIYTKPQN